jgi:hypothetical protein
MAATLGIVMPVQAHTPLCSCFDNGDGTVPCEGGYSDSSSASGVRMLVKDDAGKILQEGKMSSTSDFTFSKPATSYTVIFDAGEGHSIEIKGSDIK